MRNRKNCEEAKIIMSGLAKRVTSIPLSGIRMMFEKVAQMEDVIRLEVGEPDFNTPEHIKKAAKISLDENWTHYTSSAGLLELREAIAKKLRVDNDIYADPQTEVIVTPGACSALNLAILSIVNPGDEVLLPDPGWPHYEPCVRIAEGVPIHYPLVEENEFRIDINKLKEKVNEKTKMVIINSPQNPTGSVLTKKNFEDLSDVALQDDLLVVSDEVYEKIIYDDAKHYSIGSFPDMKDHTITVNAFSKTYAMTGWRLGFATATKDIIEQMTKLNLYSSTCANSITQRAGIPALEGLQDCVAEMVKEYKKRRDYLVDSLNKIPEISCLTPKGAIYIFLNVSRLKMSSFDCSMFLLDKGHVATVPGSAFGEMGEGYLRISFAKSIEELREAVARIQNALKTK